MASSRPVQRWTGDAFWARVARQARCADSGLDPDRWYPVSTNPARARHEAAAAIAALARPAPDGGAQAKIEAKYAMFAGGFTPTPELAAMVRGHAQAVKDALAAQPSSPGLRPRRRLGPHPPTASGTYVVMEETGMGHGARHLARTNPGHLHRGHDRWNRWNISLKFACEGQPRVTT